MEIYYDQEVDAAYIKFSDQKPSGVVEISEGIHVDVTDLREIVGTEILDRKTLFSPDKLIYLNKSLALQITNFPFFRARRAPTRRVLHH